jgi:hypothetical protein
VKKEPYDTPSDVSAVDGEVLINGLDGIALSMTPEAAAETSDRLLYGSAQAQGQKIAIRDKRTPG